MGGTVLVVDDEDMIRDLYATWLAGDHEVREAADGAAALDALDPDVDVVLLDRRMPDLPGDQVLERIRADGFDIPVAMVTAIDPDFDIFEMGFDDYIVKPVSSDELRDLVETLALRNQYDEVMREYFSLISKVVTIKTQKRPEELDANEAYREHSELLGEIKAQARDALETAIETGKFDSMFRDLNEEAESAEVDVDAVDPELTL